MKTSIKLTLCGLLVCGLCSAQATLVKNVTLEKEGTLGKFINKTEFTQVKSLTLSGRINQRDLQILYQLSSLEELYLSNVNIGYDLQYQWKDQNGSHTYSYYTSKFEYGQKIEYFSFLLFDNLPLKKLTLPRSVSVLEVDGDKQYQLEVLGVPSDFAFNIENCTFKNLIIYGNGGNREDKYCLSQKSKENKFQIDTLVLAEVDDLRYSVLEYFAPQVVLIAENDMQILFDYRSNERNVNLEDYDYIWDGAFRNTKVEEVDFGSITRINNSCFYGCKNLKSVKIPNVTEIGDYAFAYSSIEHIDMPAVQIIGKSAFAKSKLYTITLPSTFEKINDSMFDESIIDSVILTSPYAPELVWQEGSYYKHSTFIDGIEFIVPQNTLDRYQIGDWKQLNVREQHPMLSLVIKSDTVGSLKQIIRPEQYDRVQSLSISGIIDDLDFAIIRKCKFLRHLDLSQCTSYLSGKTRIEGCAKMAAYYGLFSLGADMVKEGAEADYENGESRFVDAVKTYLQGHAASSALSSELSRLDSIMRADIGKRYLKHFKYIPDNALEGLSLLNSIHFPRGPIVVEAECGGTALRTLEYHNEVQKIAGVKNVPNLQSMHFPDSLVVLGENTFTRVSWGVIDLSNTQLQSFDKTTFAHSQLVKEVHFPATLQRFRESHFGWNWVDNMKSKNKIAYYFMSKEEVFEPYHYSEIHIPKGCKAGAGWPSCDRDALIDDILW